MNRNDHLRIKRHYSLVAHSADEVELRWGVWNPTSFTMTDESQSGRLFRILRRLDGSAPVSQIAKDEGLSRSEIEVIIDYLVELGVVEEGPSNALDHYLETCVPTMKRAAEPEAQPPVLLAGDPSLADEMVRILTPALAEGKVSLLPSNDAGRRLLASNETGWLMNGIEFHERLRDFDAWTGKFVVSINSRINPIQLRAFNRVALELRIPWLHAAIDGPFLIVGPTFVPHRSACYECFETRVTMNFRESASYLSYKNALVAGEVLNGRPPAATVLGAVLASHAALETINFALTHTTFTVNKALMIHLPTMELSYNEVLRVPGCVSCGSSPERDDKELYFDVRSFLAEESESEGDLAAAGRRATS